MGHILVVGGASLDVLHFAGRTERVPGGAGLYTALAATRAGAQVTLWAPVPAPLPAELQPVSRRLTWIGPVVRPEDLPRLEYRHEGERAEITTIRPISPGAEAWLEPADLPADLSGFAIVHVIPLGAAERQLRFLRACRERGARCLSAGAARRAIAAGDPIMTDILAQADLFFLNEQEGEQLFGQRVQAYIRPGQLVFLTLGARGVIIVEAERQTALPAAPATVLDPTGAGDTFCGGTLAGLAAGADPVEAASRALPLAAATVSARGLAALLNDS